MRRLMYAVAGAGVAVVVGLGLVGQAAAPACASDNGGITLPPGFCAAVVADNIGSARHMAVAPNGDLYVALRDGRTPGAIVALRDTTGDGIFDRQEKFATTGGTGIALHAGYVYMATPTSVIRFKLNAGELVPSGAAETVVSGLPEQRQHQDKGLAFDGNGGMYVNIGAPSNDCQNPDRRPGVKGQDPCPLLEEHGGIWRFGDAKLNQTFADGHRFATGMRQMPGLTWHDGALWIVMHGRDALNAYWPDVYSVEASAELPSETLLRATDGADFGWPYCMHDWKQGKLILNPEYDGDGMAVGRCDGKTPPVAAYPGHWAPNDVEFYTGTQFPEKYRGGVFIAFHGSWNRAPLPQGGYNVVFQPMAGNRASGAYEVFADGFAGRTPLMQPNEATYRPEGVLMAPDGSLFISEGQKGRIWRVMYAGR